MCGTFFCHAHLIPRGLPGAGNLLVFDNGGSSGYGFASPIAPDRRGAFRFPHSVPVTPPALGDFRVP